MKLFLKTWFGNKQVPDRDELTCEIKNVLSVDDAQDFVRDMILLCKKYNDNFIGVYWKLDNETEWRVSY